MSCVEFKNQSLKTKCPEDKKEPCVDFSPNCEKKPYEETYRSTHKLKDSNPNCPTCKEIFLQNGADIAFILKDEGKNWTFRADGAQFAAQDWEKVSPYFFKPISILSVPGDDDEDPKKKESGVVMALVAKTGTLHFIEGGQKIKPHQKLKINLNAAPWEKGTDFVTIKISTPMHINLAIWDVNKNEFWFFDPHTGTKVRWSKRLQDRQSKSNQTKCITDSNERISNGICFFFEKLAASNTRSLSFTMKSFHTSDIQESPEDELCQTWTLYWIYKIFIEGVRINGVVEKATAAVAKAAVQQIEATCADPNKHLKTCGVNTAESLKLIKDFGDWLGGGTK